MDKLKGVNCFLSGPIDRVTDDGIIWRQYIVDECGKRNMKLDFFDPCNKPEGLGSEIGIEKNKVKKLIESGQWEEAQEFVKTFRRYDLRGIDTCNFVIARIDLNVHMCGTYDEIFTAEREGKPIFIIMGKDQRKEDIPTWLISFLNYEEIFESEDECIDYLEKIDQGEIELDRRWVLIK
ncbi:MAG: hypothetical protein J7L15_07465 [Clostridiales bacterium]|nr:hypothetical protein [Clostridiales bacterium]